MAPEYVLCIVIYLLGVLGSYIYWGIKHPGTCEEGIKIKHICKGWFNHKGTDEYGQAFLGVGTAIWPIAIPCYVVGRLIVKSIDGTFTFHKYFINLSFVKKLGNIKLYNKDC
jgi:hypothetical protein